MSSRRADVHRSTTETDIALTLDLDGSGTAAVTTGIGFFDHMLELFARHGGFDLTVTAKGDLEIGGHHTVEDIGLRLGQALREALGDKRGIARYGCIAAADGRGARARGARRLGPPVLRLRPAARGRPRRRASRPSSLRSSSARWPPQAGLTLHVRLLAGSDTHHIIEAVFKAFARALAQACDRTRRETGVPSTKGVL